MRQYLCSVRLGGSTQHVVANKVVTIPEIAILRRVHGDDAVHDIRPPKDPELRVAKDDYGVTRTEADERERLRRLYNNAHPDDPEAIVDRLFGPMAPLPQSLSQIGINPKTAADDMRRKAAELEAAAQTLVDEPEPEFDEGEDEAAFFEDEKPAAGKKAA